MLKLLSKFYSVVLIVLLSVSIACAEETSSAPAVDTYNKAIHYYEAKRWDAAKELFHRYLAEYSDTPLYVTCLYYLAYCYQQLNDKKQAILLYHKVIDKSVDGDAFWGEMSQRRLLDLEDQ